MTSTDVTSIATTTGAVERLHVDHGVTHSSLSTMPGMGSLAPWPR